MQGIFIAVAVGLVVLATIAVLVTLIEYARGPRRVQPLPVPPLARAASVDVNLEQIAVAPTAAPAPGDQHERQATVDQALARMAQAPGPSDSAWIETRPTVLAPPPSAPTTEPAAATEASH